MSMYKLSFRNYIY